MATICNGCGTTVDDRPDVIPTCEHCPSCPAELCDCGSWIVWATGDYCACFVNVEDISLAELKGLLADDCHDDGLSLDLQEVGE